MSCRINLDHVSQTFNANGTCVTLFEQLSLSINQGETYAITGPSGAGKTSLLMLIAGLAQPTTGQGQYIKGQHTLPLSELKMDVGFIFQQFHLLPELTALNNIALPLKLRGDKHAQQKARHWLDKVGLGHRADHKPSALSGGEQQRVAIARALVFEPKFIFADEPTGNLDNDNAQRISDLLFHCCQAHNAALVIVTHSEALATQTQHCYSLCHGQLQLSPTL